MGMATPFSGTGLGTDKLDTNIYRTGLGLFNAGVVFSIVEATISAGRTIAFMDPQVQIIDGGLSDRDVTLPAALDGQTFYIINSGTTNVLTVKNAAGSTIGVVGISQAGIAISGDSTWRFLVTFGGSTAITATVAQLNTLAVTAGTVTASKAVVVDSNKDIASFRDVTVRNLDAGASGTAGTVDVFPATAARGKLSIAATNQTGDTTVTLQIGAMGQATAVNLPDPGAVASYLMQSTAQVTLAEADVLDGATAGTVVLSKAVVASADKDVGTFRFLRSAQVIRSQGTPTSLATAGAETYTIAQLLTGIVVRDCAGASRTDVLPTAADLVAGIAGCAVGDTIETLIINGSDPVTEILTLDAGAGGAYDANQTAVSRTCLGTSSKLLRIRVTNITPASEAYVAYF